MGVAHSMGAQQKAALGRKRNHDESGIAGSWTTEDTFILAETAMVASGACSRAVRNLLLWQSDRRRDKIVLGPVTDTLDGYG